MFVSIPILASLVGLYIYEEQLLAAGFVFIIFVPFLWAAVELKSWATKEPYKF